MIKRHSLDMPESMSQRRRRLAPYWLMLVAFGLICWTMEDFMSGGYAITSASMPVKGGLYGPIDVTENDSNYQIIIRQPRVELGKFNAIDVEVLNQAKQYLFGFGDEFWHESGYDDGHWDETKNEMNMKIHFDQAGQYYLNVTSENNMSFRSSPKYLIEVQQQRGSAVAFYWLRWCALLLGAIIFLYCYHDKLQERN